MSYKRVARVLFRLTLVDSTRSRVACVDLPRSECLTRPEYALRANGALRGLCWPQGMQKKSGTPESEPGPVGLFTCEAPGHPHSLGQCSCSATWIRRLPPTPGGTSGLGMSPFPFPDFVDSPDSAAAEPAAAAAALPGARGELLRAVPFAAFVDSPDAAAADPAGTTAALPGARGELLHAVPFPTFIDSPDSAAAAPAAAAAATLPGPGGLQRALMFGALAAPPAATDPTVATTAASAVAWEAIHGSCNGSRMHMQMQKYQINVRTEYRLSLLSYQSQAVSVP